MRRPVFPAAAILASLFLTTAGPSRAAGDPDSGESAELAEDEPPVRKNLHLAMVPAPAAAAGIPALIALGAGFVALRRRRR